MDDGNPPRCQVALCSRPAAYRASDGTGAHVYCCAEHLPFIRSMYPPPTADEVDEVQP